MPTVARMDSATTDIHIAAAVIVDEAGRYLFVRKSGTRAFMQPGGKIDAGESALEAVVRELEEELGLVVDPSALTPLGTFTADAANEPGIRVIAEVFTLEPVTPDKVEARAEIAEAVWLAREEARVGLQLAPLSEVLFAVTAG